MCIINARIELISVGLEVYVYSRLSAGVCVCVCAECEELIKRMLTIEPARRITISEIICHRWMTMAGMDPEFDKLIHESMRPMSPEPLEPLNELVLKHMDRLEIDRKETLRVCL